MSDLTRGKRQQGSDRDIPRVESIKTLEDAKNLMNDLIDAHNNRAKTFGITSDTDSDLIKDVSIGASSTLKIRHRLGVIPSYRIILRQSGGGAITDGSGWDEKYIYLTNTGASAAIISVLVLKE